MKNKDLIGIHSKLSVIETNNSEHKYIIAKNKRLIEQEFKKLQAFLEPYEDFTIYENERITLCKKYTRKDEKGNLIVINNNYVIDKDIKIDDKDFDKAIIELKEKHKDALEIKEQQVKEYEKSLENESTLNLHLIKSDTIKDYTNAQVDLIFELIEDPTDETDK